MTQEVSPLQITFERKALRPSNLVDVTLIYSSKNFCEIFLKYFFLAKSAKFKNKSGELIALYAKNVPQKTHLLTTKAKLFNLHVISELYATSKNGQKLDIVIKKKKIIWLAYAFFENIKRRSGCNRVTVLFFPTYSYGGGG